MVVYSSLTDYRFEAEGIRVLEAVELGEDLT